MRNRKRNRIKSKDGPTNSIPPNMPPSNSVGHTPDDMFNAASVWEWTKHQLTLQNQRIFDLLVQGFDPEQIAEDQGLPLEDILDRKEQIALALAVVLVEFQIHLS